MSDEMRSQISVLSSGSELPDSTVINGVLTFALTRRECGGLRQIIKVKISRCLRGHSTHSKLTIKAQSEESGHLWTLSYSHAAFNQNNIKIKELLEVRPCAVNSLPSLTTPTTAPDSCCPKGLDDEFRPGDHSKIGVDGCSARALQRESELSSMAGRPVQMVSAIATGDGMQSFVHAGANTLTSYTSSAIKKAKLDNVLCFTFLQDSIAETVNSCNLYFSSTMSRPTLLPSSVPFCSVVFLTLATQCLAFPKVEKREMAHAYAQAEQSRKMDTGDGENISSAPEHMPQQTSSEAPMALSLGLSVIPLNKVFSVNKEHHLPGAGLLNPNVPDLHSSTEPEVSASEQGHGPSQLEGMPSEQRLSKALSIIAVSPLTSLTPHQEGPQSSSSTQPIVEGITVVTRDFPKYVDNQLFATESQEAVSLGNTPSSYVNTKEMLTASPRTEKAERDAAKRTTAFPGVDSTADTEHDGERPSEESDDNVQTTATTYLETTPEDVLNIDSTADSLLGDLKVTVSVSTAVPVSSVPRDEWNNTKFENVSQARTTDSGDRAETRVRTEPAHGAYESFEGTEGSPTSTEANKTSHKR
uniref:armadillo-like helical domain-containing protein 4 n=1 Tax=Myodes glareolus TaxID=447135 RepID=UPI0020227237|nr:armadillo-like helical domain-containing protein 4 [Myodes glareolus]